MLPRGEMANEPAIEADSLTKCFGATRAVDSLSFRVERGEVVSLLGRNGAGKTTAIKMLLGLLKPSRGSARVLGCDSQGLTPEVKRRIGYLPEGHPLFGWMRLEEAARFFAGFSPSWRRRVFDQVVDYFGLPRGRRLGQMSRGEKAQAALALTVARGPELLILDDPTQGIDAVARKEFLAALVALIRQQKRTILFSSHILGDVERVSDRVVVLDRGLKRADCPVETFKQSICRIRLGAQEDTARFEEAPGVLNVERLPEACWLTVMDPDGSARKRICAQARGPGRGGRIGPRGGLHRLYLRAPQAHARPDGRGAVTYRLVAREVREHAMWAMLALVVGMVVIFLRGAPDLLGPLGGAVLRSAPHRYPVSDLVLENGVVLLPLLWPTGWMVAFCMLWGGRACCCICSASAFRSDCWSGGLPRPGITRARSGCGCSVRALRPSHAACACMPGRCSWSCGRPGGTSREEPRSWPLVVSAFSHATSPGMVPPVRW